MEICAPGNVFRQKALIVNEMKAKWMRNILIAVGLLIVVSGCGSPEHPFNQCRCGLGVEDRARIRFEVEGEEEQMQNFMAALQEQFGTSRLTFLHFQQETYEDFFQPESRAINPDHVNSPFGMQKILIWDNFYRKAWFPDSLQMSVQIQEKRSGNRPIDPYNCTVEMRLRNSAGRDLLANCRGARHVTSSLQSLVEKHIGMPHDTTFDPDFPAKEKDYLDREAAFSLRVSDFLDPSCYPTISHFPGSNSFSMQLCEYDDMTDTLVGQVEVLSAAGDPLPFRMFDSTTDSLTKEIRILNGISGYRIFFQNVDEVAAILFHFPDGRTLRYYEKGDYTRYPYPFKPRYAPENRRKRMEEYLNKKLQPKEKVIS
jgi:hypothetical protein